LGLALEDLASLKTPGLRTSVSILSPERFPQLHATNAIAARADPSNYLIDALIAGFAAAAGTAARR
jgi:hypothetical protein